MTERTDELRDLFRSVTGTEEVTDEQLSDGDAPDPEERLAAIVGEMRERYEFATDRPTEAYVRIVRLYHEGATDEEIAARVGLSRAEAIRARLDVHLVRDGDASGKHAELAAEADRRSRQASRRFRTAFEGLLTDADLSERLTERARENELEEVTDDAEVGVDF